MPAMLSPRDELQPVGVPAGASAGSNSNGLLLTRDLIFTAKIKATAAELGYLIQVASDISAAELLIAKHQPKVILVDLTASDLCTRPALSTYRALAGSNTWIVAFGPHVQADSLAVAKAAGCQAAMPRSKFASQLPQLIHHYFTQSPPRESQAS